jgi:hypothetical protein
MPAQPFRARLLAGDRDLGDVRGEIEQVTEGGAAAWRGHFQWQTSPGLLMAANDLRLQFPEAEGGRSMFINAHTRQLGFDDQPPFQFDFQSTVDPSPVDERREPGHLPTTMQDRLDDPGSPGSRGG